MKTIIFLIISLLYVNEVYCQSYKDRQNGRDWNSFTESDKVAYLIGFYDGMKLLEMTVNGAFPDDMKEAVNIVLETVDDYSPYNYYFSEIANIIDDFYKDKANIKISIMFSIVYVVKYIKGESEDVLKTVLSNLRKDFND